MKVKVIKIGNSMGVILPSGLLEAAGLKLGDMADLEPRGGRITMVLGKKKSTRK